MRQLAEIAKDRETLSTVVELTSAFEGIASMHISQIKDQVLSSQQFFDDLWRLYKLIRVDEKFNFGRHANIRVYKRELVILVTAEGSFSGDVDQRVVAATLNDYDGQKQDVIVIGSHGASQLLQHKIPIKRSFRLPMTDRNFNVAPLVAEVQQYKTTTVFYPAYVSLTNQEVRSIQMSALISAKGENVSQDKDAIVEGAYIFEPSAYSVIDHLERSMTQIMLSQIILDSKLAQYASRFRAMHSARDKADGAYQDLRMSYSRATRRLKDERAKEIINGLRRAG
jgi:ATP synthase F1 gamma subunit